MSETVSCKYCLRSEDKQNKPGLVCQMCSNLVHLECLRRPGTPGDFECDVFFEFTCFECSPLKKELFVRNKFLWVNVILLTLHHLSKQAYGMSNNGFYHYKTHISSFIDRHWNALFGFNFKQKKNWIGTIAGVLSVYNNVMFQSGSFILRESGWWKLQHSFSPAVAAHIIQEMAHDKPKGKPRNQQYWDRNLFVTKVTEMGFQDWMHFPQESSAISKPAYTSEPSTKKRRIDEANELTSYEDCGIDIVKEERLDEASTVEEDAYYDESEQSFRGFECPPADNAQPSDSSSIYSYQQATYFDSDSRSGSPHFQLQEPATDEEEVPKARTDAAPPSLLKPKMEIVKLKRESLFSTQLNSVDLPWIEKIPEPDKSLVDLTPYQEVQLLKQVEALIPRVEDVERKACLRRLRAKLALRRLKRHRQLPVFDLDRTVKALAGFGADDSTAAPGSDRVLDRFQRSVLLDELSGTVSGGGGGGALLVPPLAEAPFRSPRSQLLLRPFVRRDRHAQPLWLRLMDELLRRTHRLEPGFEPPPRASLDYCYVQPRHVPAVNQLCATYFWPHIDLGEALQFPECSCVVLYRRLLVGAAFLVPDAAPGEAYVSFVLVRPGWRRAGIASFLVYHLLQTCTGMDVTLHVSPTNPAIFLYQKFGFKVEELVQDFYEKYFDVDYKGCRHALFLRLVR